MEGLSNLGIDLRSILFYIINIGLLGAVLWYLLYEPILKVLSDRQKTISSTIDEANNIKAEFEAKLTEMEAEKSRAQAELKTEMVKMEKFVETKKAELITSMEAERNALIDKTTAEMEKRQTQVIKEAEARLLEIMKKIVLEIVHHKVPTNVIAESVDEAWTKYKK